MFDFLAAPFFRTAILRKKDLLDLLVCAYKTFSAVELVSDLCKQCSQNQNTFAAKQNKNDDKERFIFLHQLDKPVDGRDLGMNRISCHQIHIMRAAVSEQIMRSTDMRAFCNRRLDGISGIPV